MFKKTRIAISTMNENAQIWVAMQLTTLHIKFNIYEKDTVNVTYDMKVSEKQLSNIIKWIVPRSDVTVRMILKDNIAGLRST